MDKEVWKEIRKTALFLGGAVLVCLGFGKYTDFTGRRERTLPGTEEARVPIVIETDEPEQASATR